jgi:hypothetical protein
VKHTCRFSRLAPRHQHSYLKSFDLEIFSPAILEIFSAAAAVSVRRSRLPFGLSWPFGLRY